MPTVSRGVFNWLFRSPAVLEDFGDRINHFWTFGLLLLLAAIVSWNQGYNQPITCWTPDNFTSFQSNYAHKVCWNSHIIQYPKKYESAYSYDAQSNGEDPQLPVEYPLVVEKRASMDRYFPYNKTATRTVYQWLPLILCLQAVLFKLPSVLFYLLHGLSGLTFERIGTFFRGFENLNLRDRNLLCKYAAQYVYDWCVKLDFPLSLKPFSFIWLFVKILYCVNIILQLYFIDTFIKTTNTYNLNSTSYTNIITGNIFGNNATEWKESSAFPRLIYCLFDIHKIRNIDKHHIQCHLPANSFNEQICVFVWVWFHFVAVATILSFLIWLIKVLVPVFRRRYISGALLRADNVKASDLREDDLKSFCKVLGEDGVMVLKLISANSSESLIGEIMGYMWKLRQDRYEEWFQKSALLLSKKFYAKQASHAKLAAQAKQDSQTQEEHSDPETDV